MDAIRIRRRGLGRPRQRPGRAMADKAYSSRANRAWLRRHHITAVIPVKEDQKKHRRDRGRASRSPAGLQAPAGTKSATPWNAAFAKLKQFRAVATRYDKREQICPGTIDVASISIWRLRKPVLIHGTRPCSLSSKSCLADAKWGAEALARASARRTGRILTS